MGYAGRAGGIHRQLYRTHDTLVIVETDRDDVAIQIFQGAAGEISAQLAFDLLADQGSICS